MQTGFKHKYNLLFGVEPYKLNTTLQGFATYILQKYESSDYKSSLSGNEKVTKEKKIIVLIMSIS